MRRAEIQRLAFLSLLVMLAASCAEVPITGRSYLKLVDDATIQQMSYDSYAEFLHENKLSKDAQAGEAVRRVGGRIQKAVEEYFAQNDLSHKLAGYAWEFNLIESDEVNAWCMPGGKVVVYSGILPLTKDEAGLAVVVGHEIAHAVADHSSERVSQELLVSLGGMALGEALAQKPVETQRLVTAAFGAGSSVGFLLPYSRLHESEADRLGLIFMAMAGYDPRVAVEFWQRMAALKQGAQIPEFLSTHPSDQTRIENIKQLAETEALPYYRPPQK